MDTTTIPTDTARQLYLNLSTHIKDGKFRPIADHLTVEQTASWLRAHGKELSSYITARLEVYTGLGDEVTQKQIRTYLRRLDKIAKLAGCVVIHKTLRLEGANCSVLLSR